MSNIIIYGERDNISTVNQELIVQKEGNREVSRENLLHCCFIDSAIFSIISSKKPVFRGLNMENLLHRCLIEKAKKEIIIQRKPLKSDFVDKNLFDCCLMNDRIELCGTGALAPLNIGRAYA